jgi:hypothetical protein
MKPPYQAKQKEQKGAEGLLVMPRASISAAATRPLVLTTPEY